MIGVILKKTNGKKEKHETKSKPLSCPWVDEDLKDGTDHHLEEEGKKNLILWALLLFEFYLLTWINEMRSSGVLHSDSNA